MHKEYDANITSSYSNLKSYGSENNFRSIVAPVPVESKPFVFWHMTPHKLPKWMTPIHKQTEMCVPCFPYNCLPEGKEKCH